jgi:hypothetical protein
MIQADLFSCHRLGFHRHFDIVLFGNFKDDSVRVLCGLRPMDMPTCGADFFFQLSQIHIHVFDGVQPYIRPDLA